MFVPNNNNLGSQKSINNTPGHLPTFYYSIPSLPSKGLAYPPNSEIKYRPYTFGEIKQLSYLKNPNLKVIIESILNGVESSFDKTLITLPDIIFIGLLRNITSTKDAGFRFTSYCDSCGEKIIKDILLKDISFKDLSVPELPVVVELSGEEYHFTPITIADYYFLLEHKKEDDQLAIMAKQCRNHDFDKVYKVISELTDYDDREAILEVDKLLFHEVEPINVICNNCNSDNVLEFDGGQTLVTPFRQSSEPPRSRIRFGISPKNKSN